MHGCIIATGARWQIREDETGNELPSCFRWFMSFGTTRRIDTKATSLSFYLNIYHHQRYAWPRATGAMDCNDSGLQ
jgi:hypothetical protein